MKLTVFILLVFTIFSTSAISQIFIAPYGDDTNPGTIDLPLESIQKAQELAAAGDTVFIRGGEYKIRPDQISRIERNLFACISYLDKSGTEDQTIKYWAYPGETPVFDFSDVKPEGKRVVGIYIVGSYVHIKGLEMTGIQVTITTHTESYCIYSRGDNNIFEQISMHDNIGTGLRHYKGGNNLFLNCDAYRNHDDVSEDGLGSNNDGFGCHPDPGGTGNVFRGCRAWFNSDDGFDIIRADEPVVFENCWAFYNGFSTSFESLGDGNGFKAGGYAYDEANKIPSTVPRHTVRFCVAVRNKANGFYSNHHLGGNDWYNNSAYLNKSNFNMVNRESPQSDNIWVDGYDHVLKNNLSYKSFGFGSKEIAYIDSSLSIVENNSFNLPITITEDDFESLDMNLLEAPRQPDGSLPDIDFMRPVQGSDIIDAGVDIGFEFLENAPDLGAFEISSSTDVGKLDALPKELRLYSSYPNPFNLKTTIRYALRKPGNLDIAIYNFKGQKVRTLIQQYQSPGEYSIVWNGENEFGESVASGIYFYSIHAAESIQTKKMLLMK